MAGLSYETITFIFSTVFPAVAVIVVEPLETAVIFPLDETVATDSLLDFHVDFISLGNSAPS